MSLLKTQSHVKCLTVRLALEHKNKTKGAHQKLIRKDQKKKQKTETDAQHRALILLHNTPESSFPSPTASTNAVTARLWLEALLANPADLPLSCWLSGMVGDH